MTLIPPFSVTQKKYSDQWAYELNDKKFIAAIVCPDDKNFEKLTSYLKLLTEKFAIKHILLNVSDLESVYMVQILNEFPGIKFFTAKDVINKELLPDPQNLTRLQQQELYQNTLTMLHRSASVNDIEQGLKQCLENHLNIEF
ncbi:MAG: hypothetical protein KDD40_04305, partial [Bdellovibrionales bacterium]|nr:hypothetical protein [Bdellovibrionales bacterium]